MATIMIVFVLITVEALSADYVTLTAGGSQLPGIQTYEVRSNIVAQIIYLSFPNQGSPKVFVNIPSTTNTIYYAQGLNNNISLEGSGPIFVGPATITLVATNNFSTSPWCTITTSPASGSSFTPSGSVVIPNDNGGPVTIILESSTDLVTWTAANPGTYGTTSSNRFFRIRAQR